MHARPERLCRYPRKRPPYPRGVYDRRTHGGDLFYITCIGDPQKLAPFYEKYRETYHVVYSKDIYSGEQWLEIMPKTASKANAVLELKEKLGCEKLVVFGDGKNDLDMFHAADEAYAVQNADKELKAAATAVIGGNNEDGVAKWLLEHVGQIRFLSDRKRTAKSPILNTATEERGERKWSG